MEQLELKATTRTLKGKAVKQLRNSGLIPIVLYGHNIKPSMLSVNIKEFNHIYSQAGGSSLVKLYIDEVKEPVNIIFHQTDFHPVTDEPVHADFLQVKLTEKIHAEIPIILEGAEDAPVVKEKEGSIVLSKQKIEVEAFPQDLVHEITIDVINMAEFSEVIHIKDIKVPEKITVLDDPDEIVVYIQEPRSEEELAELEEEVKEDVESVEVEKKGKEEVEGEEGEAVTDENAKPEESDKKE